MLREVKIRLMTECPNCGKINYRSSTVLPESDKVAGLGRVIIEPAQFAVSCSECDAVNLQITIEPLIIYCAKIDSN